MQNDDMSTLQCSNSQIDFSCGNFADDTCLGNVSLGGEVVKDGQLGVRAKALQLKQHESARMTTNFLSRAATMSPESFKKLTDRIGSNKA
ncbi:MAG: hypothetical protein FRX49_00090 [Trebouxia sp. A1-2]|nr:MAG: hypothetical protein FRX49_00090 [Trebouxia sp. A1-2]